MELWDGRDPGLKGGPGRELQGLPEQEPQPVAIFCAQLKSHIEVYLRPLVNDAYALVFFSRRTDMPYRFHSSLAQLNFTSSRLYEVSALQVVSAFCFPWEGVAEGGPHSDMASLSHESCGRCPCGSCRH